MDILLYLKAALMGIVEGLTEFLPVSSTGHLIVAGSFLGFNILGKETFMIAIQSAAILAVVWEYRARLIRLVCGLTHDKKEQNLALNVVIAFIPAAILGVLFNDAVEARLFTPISVACAFVIGGLIILWIERKKDRAIRVASIEDMTWKDALKVGLFQCFALIPGTSRSGATIIGALLCGLSRPAAAEFSFFLAMPTIAGATVWSLWKARHTLDLTGQGSLYLIASVAAFLSALACVRWFLKYVGTHDFKWFAWYRIAFGILILLTLKSMT
jgi:undecaprenyl-diphosphatase